MIYNNALETINLANMSVYGVIKVGRVRKGGEANLPEWLRGWT